MYFTKYLVCNLLLNLNLKKMSTCLFPAPPIRYVFVPRNVMGEGLSPNTVVTLALNLATFGRMLKLALAIFLPI